MNAMDDDKEQTMKFVNNALEWLGEAQTKDNAMIYSLLALTFAEHRQANALEDIASYLRAIAYKNGAL